MSVRAKNVLHRMGIHSVETLLTTPLDAIAEQRNIGAKTYEEIKNAITRVIRYGVESLPKNAEASFGSEIERVFSDEQMEEMSHRSIDELNLSTRLYNALKRTERITMDQIVSMTESDFSEMKGLGRKSRDEFHNAVNRWLQKNLILNDEEDEEQKPVNDAVKNLLRDTAATINPIVPLYWKQLYEYLSRDGVLDEAVTSKMPERIKIVLSLSGIRHAVKTFWETALPDGIAECTALTEYLALLKLPFDYSILLESALSDHVLLRESPYFLIARNSFSDACEKICDSNDRAAQILQFRIEGETLQDIADLYGLTRERVRQISNKLINRFPPLYEDYFQEPFQAFRFTKEQFTMAFPDISEEGYEYMSIRFTRGKNDLAEETLERYNGLWKDRLCVFLQEEGEQLYKKTAKKTEVMMQVLMRSLEEPLTLEELEQAYYSYIERRGLPAERLKINIRSIANHLRNTRGVVFNKENKVRFCNADPQKIWKNVAFARYNNTVISSELIFRDNRDLMDELDIRDGYELFYIIKTSLSMRDNEIFKIRCRRVPVILLGDMSEEEQAVRFLKEVSPIAYLDYFAAYEERYGVKKETVQGNPVITNALLPYYLDGRFAIDVPSIDERDLSGFSSSLHRKTFWFMEEIEELFAKECTYSSKDALNTASLRRVGYVLNTGYAFDAKYGTVTRYFDEEIFSGDVIDLNSMDRRLVNLPAFISALNKKKMMLELLETAPKQFLSIAKINEIYGLTKEEIRKIQQDLSEHYQLPFFNGHSIWQKIKHLPLIQQLQENEWMLTCILRQQETVGSLQVAGGIILSQNSKAPSLSNICEWMASVFGKMTVQMLEKTFNDMFGTRVPASKFAEKLKSSGMWNCVIVDSMDEYIDRMFDTGFSEVNGRE